MLPPGVQLTMGGVAHNIRALAGWAAMVRLHLAGGGPFRSDGAAYAANPAAWQRQMVARFPETALAFGEILGTGALGLTQLASKALSARAAARAAGAELPESQRPVSVARVAARHYGGDVAAAEASRDARQRFKAELERLTFERQPVTRVAGRSPPPEISSDWSWVDGPSGAAAAVQPEQQEQFRAAVSRAKDEGMPADRARIACYEVWSATAAGRAEKEKRALALLA
jgi:hypothetical protein